MPELILFTSVWPLALYLLFGMLVPVAMARAWMRKSGQERLIHVQDLFGRGELGLLGLALTVPIIWDIQRSTYAPQTIAAGSVLLGITGMMAAAVWVESYCRTLTGTRNEPRRAWRDSRNLAFFIFTMAGVAEILLYRLARVLSL
jgi:hypothetical protein